MFASCKLNSKDVDKEWQEGNNNKVGGYKPTTSDMNLLKLCLG